MTRLTISWEGGATALLVPKGEELLGGRRAADLQDLLTCLARVQEQHAAGAFAGQPNVSMLMHRAVPAVMELIRLRVRVGELETEARLHAGHGDLFERGTGSGERGISDDESTNQTNDSNY